MIGNISKSKGFKGDRGYKGDGLKYEDLTPEQIESLKGEPGEVGGTPVIAFRYDEETGMLYCSSDGILADKEYINSKNLITKAEAGEYITQAVSTATEEIVTEELKRAKESGVFDGKDGDPYVLTEADIQLLVDKVFERMTDGDNLGYPLEVNTNE